MDGLLQLAIAASCGNPNVVSHFMKTFTVRKQIVTNEHYQGYNLTEFSIANNYKENDIKIIDSFLRSDFFNGDLNSEDYIHGNLSQVFKINKIDIDRFRKFDKANTAKFLVDFLNNPSWENDRREFSTLLDKYFEVHQTLCDREFYVLNRDWFNKESDILNSINWIFIYYFLIIYIDRDSKTILLTEWTYD